MVKQLRDWDSCCLVPKTKQKVDLINQKLSFILRYNFKGNCDLDLGGNVELERSLVLPVTNLKYV